ncbi:MAG: tetratricopeptide repeat protein, partial [Gaiellaceae bacterium]
QNLFFGAGSSVARFYSEALDLWPADDEERPYLLLRHGKALHPRGGGTDVLTAAAEQLLDAGDREAAAEAETLLGEVLWLQGRQAEAFEHLEGAVALLADEPASRAKALTLADLARFRAIGDRAAEAVLVGSEALAMAEALGLDELRAHTLNTLGLARVMTGDRSGLDDLQRSIDISRGLVTYELSRGLNNLASTLVALGELDEAHQLYAESAAVAERLGWTAAILWLVAEQADAHYHRGQWDEALAVTEKILQEAASGERHLREIDAHVIGALIRLDRDDPDGALEHSAAGLEFARESPDPQTLFPALACRARVLAELGRREEADEVVRELLERWRSSPATLASTWLSYACPAIVALGRGEELAAVAKDALVTTKWLEAGLALAGGDFEKAARVYARIGSRPDEAHARLRAAETLAEAGRRKEAEQELETATAFFEEVGAARYVRMAGELLTSS